MVPVRESKGERPDRRRWRIKGGERVAGVGVQRSRSVGKAHTGHPNRNKLKGHTFIRLSIHRPWEIPLPAERSP